MKKINLVKSLTNLVNNRKGLLILCLSLATIGVNEAWGYGENTSYVLNDSKEYSLDYSKGVIHTYSFSEPGATVSYKAKRENAAIYYHLYVQYSKDNSNWVQIQDNTSIGTSYPSSPFTCSIPSDARYIRFELPSGQTKKKTIGDVKITRATTISANSSKIEFGATTPNVEVTKTISVSYNNTTYNQLITGTCTNNFFSVVSQEVGATGTTDITIKYKPTSVGEHSGTVTLNMNGKSTSFTVTGSCQQTYYFKADAQMSPSTGGGSVYSSFVNNSFSSSSATTNATSTNSDVTKTAYFKAEANTAADYNFVGWYSDKELTSRVTESATYNQDITSSATSESSPQTLTLYAYFVQTFIPEFNGGNKTIAVGNTNSEITFNHTSTIYPSASSSDNFYYIISDEQRSDEKNVNPQSSHVIGYNSSTGEIIAYNAGTAKITFYQKEDNAKHIAKGQSSTYTITVSKIANTLTAAAHSMKVDETWSSVINGKNSDGEITTESDFPNIAYFDKDNNKICAPNSEAASFNSKEVTITIRQAATYKYTAVEKTITVTVNKHVPTFTWSNATLYHNQTYNDFFTTNCPNALSVKSSSDDGVAYLVDGTNAQKLNLKTLTKAASTTLTVTQAENYYWAEHTESKTITPNVAPNHVPFTYNEAMFNDGNITITKAGTSNIFMVDNGRYVQLGDDATTISGGDAWKEKYIVIKFDGIPEKVSFEYATSSGASTSPDFKVYESTNGTNFNEIFSDNRNSSSWSSTITKDLSKDTRYLKFFFDGNYGGQYQHIKVTELKTFSTDKTELDFGSNKIDVPCASQTFTFNYANVGHKVSLTTNDPQFTVSPSSITNIGGEKYGSVENITVSYSTAAVHTASGAKLTISDELGNSTQIDLVGNTTKKIQTITWNVPYNVSEPAIPIGKMITNAASAGSNLPIIYESSDESIIEILDNGAAFRAKALGPATITAKQAGNEDWASVSDSKTFKATNKSIQVISWNQSFTRLLSSTASVPLTATVEIENPTTGDHIYNKERSDMLVYTSGDNNVITINGHTLNVVAKGKTTITATIAGNDDYEETSVTIPVIVRDPSSGCEDVLISTNLTSEYEFWHFSYTEDMEKVVAIDRSSASIPGKMTFQHKGEKWGLNYSGNIDVYESTDNGKTFTYLGPVSPVVGKYQQSQEFSLSRNATHLKFFRDKHATGYHYIKDIEILPAQFIEVSSAAIEFGDVTVNSIEEQTITINYGNAKSDFTITNTNAETKSSLSITPDAINIEDCGETSNQSLTFIFNPKSVGPFNTSILVNDLISGKSATITITANVILSAQHITWNPTQTEYRTKDQIELNATASSGNPVKYYVLSGSEVADFENGILTIKKDGPITIRAYEPGDALWAAATDVDKTFTIRKTDLHFDPLPTAAAITYPQTLSESALTDGIVKDEDGNVVAGTIAWTNPTTQLNAGENQSQGISFTPTTNPAWYNTLSSSTTVTVLKANPIANASAGNITYGQKVNESVLTNNGTEGTWSWAEDEKDQVLVVGTHEGLKVHFTPTDQANYNEIDGVVSLTVTTATPVLTWTAEHATANTVDALTFAASSTNTDIDAEIIYSIIAGDDCASIDASTGVLTITKAGTITVQASQVATINFNAPTSITTTCAISLTPTEIVTAPEIDGDIVYGTQLKDLKLKANTGAAQNTVNQQAVEGTFAITSGDLSTAGEHTVTVTFTPTNTDMFATCTKEINVTVQKANPSATAHASEIIYGAKVESSVLTNTGTTEGTWTWNDEQNEQELAVGTHEGLKVHFTPTDQANYNEIDGTVSLTVNKAAATLNWTSAPTEADVKDQLTYSATSNHSESAITYAITEGNDYATIDANTGVLTIIKAGTITVQASQATTDNYEAATITINTTLSGEFESVFNGNGDWNNPNNWTHGVPEGDNPNVVISGSLTITGSISVGGLTIEQNGKVNIVNNGDLTVNGISEDRETYGNLFVRNGGNITINESAEVKVYDFVVESSIGTTGTSISGQVTNGDKVICTNGAYIDINMDPDGIMDDTQWYGFTVPFPVDVQNGIARKEGDVFRKCTYGVEYFIAEYDMTQRLNSGKGWKYIKSGQLQPGRFYYFTVNGNHNVYSFKAADNTITINNETQLVVNGEGPNANWNAVGNSTLTYTSISGENVPNYVQTYINGESRYITVAIDDAQFVVGCPFFFQAKQEATMVLNKTDETNKMHYAPRQTMDKPICVRIAEEGKHFSDQMYLTASEDALDEYELGLDLAKAGIGTKSAQLWVNAYGLQLCVNNATLINNQAYYNLSVYAPQAGNYELSLPDVPTNGILYLLQDGYPIWNLNESPYTLECAKGTTNEYGLLFVEQEPQAPTGSQTISGNLSAQKILKDQQIYIQKNGTIFTISGQKVK